MRILITIVIAALSLNAFGQVPDYVPSDGLVAWYPLNGDGEDFGTHELDGTVLGPQETTDRFGNLSGALSFDGIDDYLLVSFNDVLALQGEISIAVWVYMDGGTGASTPPRILEIRGAYGGGGNAGYVMLTHGNSNLERTLEIRHYSDFGNSNLAISPTSSVSALDWHHLVFTASQGEGVVRFYVDGQLMDEDTSSDELSPVDYNGNDLFIGAEPNLAGKWGGHLDELGIWSRALSASEVTSLFNTPSPIQGCTDDAACNFDQDATVDDGSCTPSGCMDTDACNFNSEAECEGEACDYSCCPGPGCCNEGTYWDEVTQTCIITNPTDTNLDGCTDLNDLMDILSAYGDCAVVEFASCGDLLEYQGYDYETVLIGEQCWFAENLRAENYTDGSSIPLNSIENPVSGPNPNYKCFYGDDLSNVAENGMLYSWFASADSRGICPVGWHLPSLTDFESLTQEVGGVSNAGSALKAVDPTWNGNDDYGFTAIPSGYFNWVNAPSISDPVYFFMGSHAYYWSSESTGSNSAYYMILWPDQNSASLLPSNGNFAEDAMSVRCIKD
jgi:uncharacterized protein (TIGR02145 family)